MTLPATRKLSRNVLRIEFTGIKAGWEQWILLSSDRHVDNPESNIKLQKKHLDEARDRKALIIDIGDCLCAMQGRNDKRGSKGSVKDEHKKSNYFDAIVKSAAELFAPYPFVSFAMGNHEQKIMDIHETNLVERMVERMHAINPKSIATVGGMSGWIVFGFKGAGRLAVKRLWYHHGYGGDAPVTKGTIQTQRQAAYLPDADIVITGHSHNEWQFPIARARIGFAGNLYQDEQLHLKIPSYKDDYGDGHGSWDVGRGAPPKPIGAIWLRFYFDSTRAAKEKDYSQIKFEVTRAK